MAELKIKHGSWTFQGTRYGVGIHTVTGDAATAANTYATANPTIAEYTGTTFSGAAATVYSAGIWKMRSLQPEIGALLTKQQKNQAAYEAARVVKGRAPDLEWEPLAETSGDFNGIDHTDPAFAGNRWEQGDLPADPGQSQQLAPPQTAAGEKAMKMETREQMYSATTGEMAHQPEGTNYTDAQAGGSAGEADDEKAAEKAAKAAQKANEKAQKEAAKEKSGK